MWRILLDFVFPRRSLSGVEGAWVTEDERRQLRPVIIVEECEELRGKGIVFLDRLTAASSYRSSPLLRKAIHTFKYRRIPGLAEDLARLLPPVTGEAMLVPVPLHWTREFQRGFNQSEVLAAIVGRERGLPVQTLLRRVRSTGHQAWRKRKERLGAMHAAFRFTGGEVPRRVILIDDLCTTGSTLDACARALKEAGVGTVEGLVVARG